MIVSSQLSVAVYMVPRPVVEKPFDTVVFCRLATLQFKLNPPQLEIPEDILSVPNAEYPLPTIAEALEDAKINAWPDRRSRRYA